MQFGLIGAGCIGQLRARALARIPGTKLVAVTEINRQRATQAAAPARARVCQDAAELVGLQVEVIVTSGSQAIQAVKLATSTIPVVMAVSGDPLETGFVTSLARPGENLTGLSLFAPELSGKRLELLKEAVPAISHVAVLPMALLANSTMSARSLAMKVCRNFVRLGNMTKRSSAVAR